jgi:hypothetical protein
MSTSTATRTAPARSYTRAITEPAPRAAYSEYAAPAPIAKPAPVPRRRYTPEEVTRLIAEEQRLCDATPVGERFYSELLGMNLLKTLPFTEEEVYDCY